MFVYKSKTKVYQVIWKENFQHIFLGIFEQFY